MFTGLNNILWNFPVTQIGYFAVDHWNFIFPPVALICGFYLFKAVLNSILDALIKLFLQLFCKACGSGCTGCNNDDFSPDPVPPFNPNPPAPSLVPAWPLVPSMPHLGSMALQEPQMQTVQQPIMQHQTISQPALTANPAMQQLGVTHQAEISQPAQMPMLQGLGASAVNYIRGGQTTHEQTSVGIGGKVETVHFGRHEEPASLPTPAPPQPAALPENTAPPPIIIEGQVLKRETVSR